jgi:hypothetical protein
MVNKEILMDRKMTGQIKVVAFIVLLLGIAMLVYWGMFVLQGMPIAGIPVLSELVNAGLAFVSGIGLLRLRKWSIPTTLFTAGMWAYGVLGGINLVLKNGLDFSSPFGALTDAVLFPLILIFSVYLSIVVWRDRELFH